MPAKYIAMTPLDKSLKRALNIKGRDYVITLSPDALKITEKGHRLGLELKWAELISGESALAVALHASLGKFAPDTKATRPNLKELLPQRARVKASGNSAPASKKRASMKRSRRRASSMQS
jgi:hypothetical protein